MSLAKRAIQWALVLCMLVGGSNTSSAFCPVWRSAFRPTNSLQQQVRLSAENSEDDSFHLDELKQRMEQQLNQYYDLLMTEDDSDREKARPGEFVHIVCFNPGSEDEDEQQGVHTIEYPKGSGNNILLAFESEDDCVKFATMLKEMQFYDPIPQAAPLAQLESFCQALGVPVKVVPEGRDLRPPSDNVEDLSMNPNLKQDKERLNRLFGSSDDDTPSDAEADTDAWQ